MQKKHLSIPLLLLPAVMAFHSQVSAQDKIHRKNGNVVEAKITEISINEIKYKSYDNLEGPTYTIEKNNIKQIVFENGKIEKFDSKYYDSEDTEWYQDNRKHAIKVGMLSYLFGHTYFGYERNIKPGQAMEFTLSFIGLGVNQELTRDFITNAPINVDSRGIYVGAGYKFNNMPSFIFFGKPRQKHLFHGTYIRPNIYLGTYSRNFVKYNNVSTYVDRDNIWFGNIMMEFGKQWEFANRILFDIHFGVGYGFDNYNKLIRDDNSIYSDAIRHYASARVFTGSEQNNVGLAFNLTAKVGYLFNPKKQR